MEALRVVEHSQVHDDAALAHVVHGDLLSLHGKRGGQHVGEAPHEVVALHQLIRVVGAREAQAHVHWARLHWRPGRPQRWGMRWPWRRERGRENRVQHGAPAGRAAALASSPHSRQPSVRHQRQHHRDRQNKHEAATHPHDSNKDKLFLAPQRRQHLLHAACSPRFFALGSRKKYVLDIFVSVGPPWGWRVEPEIALLDPKIDPEPFQNRRNLVLQN